MDERECVAATDVVSKHEATGLPPRMTLPPPTADAAAEAAAAAAASAFSSASVASARSNTVMSLATTAAVTVCSIAAAAVVRVLIPQLLPSLPSPYVSLTAQFTHPVNVVDDEHGFVLGRAVQPRQALQQLHVLLGQLRQARNERVGNELQLDLESHPRTCGRARADARGNERPERHQRATRPPQPVWRPSIHRGRKTRPGRAVVRTVGHDWCTQQQVAERRPLTSNPARLSAQSASRGEDAHGHMMRRRSASPPRPCECEQRVFAKEGGREGEPS